MRFVSQMLIFCSLCSRGSFCTRHYFCSFCNHDLFRGLIFCSSHSLDFFRGLSFCSSVVNIYSTYGNILFLLYSWFVMRTKFVFPMQSWFFMQHNLFCFIRIDFLVVVCRRTASVCSFFVVGFLPLKKFFFHPYACMPSSFIDPSNRVCMHLACAQAPGLSSTKAS
jgi:hypothetical protein